MWEMVLPFPNGELKSGGWGIGLFSRAASLTALWKAAIASLIGFIALFS
jgi:hypothetical protein